MGVTPPSSYPALFGAAACRSADPGLFFQPDREQPADRAGRERAAKTFCSTCPISRACLEWALSVNEREGIWGGLNEEERGAIMAARRRESPLPGRPRGRPRKTALAERRESVPA